MGLCRAVAEVTRRASVRDDRRFCQQLTDAATAVPTNVAEGFARYGLREFMRYLSVARGSVAEVQTWLILGRDRGYLTAEETEALLTLSRRTGGALAALMRALRGKLAERR